MEYWERSGRRVKGAVRYSAHRDVPAGEGVRQADPPGVQRAGAGKELIPMLLAGELDAAMVSDRNARDPRLAPAIPDSLATASTASGSSPDGSRWTSSSTT
jgi:hypothetical protein